MKTKISTLLFYFFLSNIALADCIIVNNNAYCGNGKCVELNGVGYCSKHENGEAHIHKGRALCGAGKCLTQDGSLYCSQYPGGGIIKNYGALWSGPGKCIKHNDNVRCAKEPRGTCININGNVKCQGGWTKEIPILANRCERADIL